ncbi:MULTISPECIES: hypothetical protein [unclassified Modestobacter]
MPGGRIDRAPPRPARRLPIDTPRRRCADAHLGCTCRGDDAVHDQRARERDEARAQAGDVVPCPECGRPTTPFQLVTWGNCRACRTAQSRSMEPLRW